MKRKKRRKEEVKKDEEEKEEVKYEAKEGGIVRGGEGRGGGRGECSQSSVASGTSSSHSLHCKLLVLNSVLLRHTHVL